MIPLRSLSHPDLSHSLPNTKIAEVRIV